MVTLTPYGIYFKLYYFCSYFSKPCLWLNNCKVMKNNQFNSTKFEIRKYHNFYFISPVRWIHYKLSEDAVHKNAKHIGLRNEFISLFPVTSELTIAIWKNSESVSYNFINVYVYKKTTYSVAICQTVSDIPHP